MPETVERRLPETVIRKFVVFISSTKKDLEKHRQEVIEAVIRLGHIPSAMEYFVTGRTAVSYIDRKVSECDIFLLLLGYRPGTKAGDLTFVQYEYEAAKKYGKEIRFLMLQEKDFLEHNPDPSLVAFRNEILKAGTEDAPLVRTFPLDDPTKTGAEATATLVSLTAEMQGAERGGWIQAEHYDRVKNNFSLEEASKSPFYQRYVTFFRSFRTLNVRSTTKQSEKQAIGSYIWERFLTDFESAEVEAIYFESGSSTAYVSYALLEYIREHSEWYYKSRLHDVLTIVTNNFLTLMDFTIYQDMVRPMADIVLYPKGQVRDKYGVTYGPLAEAGPYAQTEAFEQRGWALDHRAATACSTVTTAIDQLLGKKGVIMMAVSGIDWDRTKHFYGPHVGSYPNMLMKRCLLRSMHPKIVVVDDFKWKNRYDADKCFPICGDGLNWADILIDQPMAFAVGVSDANNATIVKRQLDRLQFKTTRKESLRWHG